MGGDWIDVSVSLHTGMVHWPGNPPVRIERAQSIDQGASSNVSALSLGAHTGTHMDAPVHFFNDGTGIESLPLEATIGPARVVAIHDSEAVGVAELELADPREGERLLLKTRNSTDAWAREDFVKDFVYIAADAARLLAERRVQTVGVDYLSVGGYKRDGRQTHEALLGAGVCIIEGLDLSHVAPGEYDLVCLPIKVRGGDGAPARAALRAR